MWPDELVDIVKLLIITATVTEPVSLLVACQIWPLRTYYVVHITTNASTVTKLKSFLVACQIWPLRIYYVVHIATNASTVTKARDLFGSLPNLANMYVHMYYMSQKAPNLATLPCWCRPNRSIARCCARRALRVRSGF